MNPAISTLAALALAAKLVAHAVAAESVAVDSAATLAPAQQALSAAISRLIEGAIPPEYEKQKDWGETKTIEVPRLEGKLFHTHLVKRERQVDHGVWKHYRLRLIEPEQNLHVALADLRPLTPGRVAFTLHIDAKVDAWARAKVYHYGVHIIALEMEGDMRVGLAIGGELGIQLRRDEQGSTVALVPTVTDARLDLNEFHLRRVSNAHGPIVHELGDGVRHVVEEELNGPKLVEKLNRAIEKKRDRLGFRPAELWEGSWWSITQSTGGAQANRVNEP